MKGQQGFTLLELMTTVAIGAIVLVAGEPALETLVSNNRMTANANTFVMHLNFARSEAIKTRSTVTVAAKSGSTNWHQGWVVTESGNTVRDAAALRNPLSLTGTGSQVQFQSSGDLAGITSHTFELCEDRSGESGRRIAIETTGRISVTAFTCS